MSKDNKEEKKEKVTLEDLNKKVNSIAATLRKNTENWKRFIKNHVDEGSDGEIGSAGIKQLVLGSIIALAILVAPVFAENIDDKSAGTGTYSLDQASNGTGDITLTVDAVAAGITGDVTTDDINMSGAVGDTLGFNVTKAVSVTGLAATVTIDIDGTAVDTDFASYVVEMNNDSNETFDVAEIRYISDDVSSNSEDTAIEIYNQIGGTKTKSIDINTGVDFATAVNLNADSTATNITMDTGSTLAVDLVTVDAVSGVSGTVTDGSTFTNWFNNGILTNSI